MPYWVLADLEARMSREVVLAIIDDDNDGVADAGVIAQLQADSDAYVDGFIAGVYDVVVAHAANVPQLKRLSLDVAEAYAWKRWPTIARGEWSEQLDMVRKELIDIKAGRITLGIATPPEPNASTEAADWAGDDDTTVSNELVFNGVGRMGDF